MPVHRAWQRSGWQKRSEFCSCCFLSTASLAEANGVRAFPDREGVGSLWPKASKAKLMFWTGSQRRLCYQMYLAADCPATWNNLTPPRRSKAASFHLSHCTTCTLLTPCSARPPPAKQTAGLPFRTADVVKTSLFYTALTEQHLSKPRKNTIFPILQLKKPSHLLGNRLA